MASSNQYAENIKNGKAIPEYRLIKKGIYKSREKAEKQLTNGFTNNRKHKNELKSKFYSYFLDLIKHVNEDNISNNLTEKLESYEKIFYDDKYDISKIPKKAWHEIFITLDRIGVETGIFEITGSKKEEMFGYEIFDGIGWKPNKIWKNWDRTLVNIRHAAKALKNKDKDLRILVFSRISGLGKSNFGLQLMKEVQKVIDTEKISERNIITKYNELLKVRDEEISPFQIDELITLLNSKRALSNEHVETEEILSKIRDLNLFGIACTAKPDNLSESDLKNFHMGVEMIEEGKFKFYKPETFKKFKKESSGWEKPQADWIGHFPMLDGSLWQMYKKEVKGKKHKTRKELKEEREKEEKEENKVECNDCGYTWEPRKDNPARCPKCQSTKWNK